MKRKYEFGYIGEKKSFAHGLNFYKLFWIFFIGCFLGVVVEMLWCLATNHYIESRRGVIYGPFNPVYGFGAVAMTLCLYWFRKKRDLWIFIGGTLVGAGFEYLCSWVQEFMLGTISWDYSAMPFNINGRINLLYSFFWGLLALLWLKAIYPFMERWIEKIPNRIGYPLTWILVVFMVLNMAISAIAVDRMTARQQGKPSRNQFETFVDAHYDDELMKTVYPNMVCVE